MLIKTEHMKTHTCGTIERPAYVFLTELFSLQELTKCFFSDLISFFVSSLLLLRELA